MVIITTTRKKINIQNSVISFSLFLYYQTSKEIDDFYQTMYGEEDGKTKSTNEEITDETRKR